MFFKNVFLHISSSSGKYFPPEWFALNDYVIVPV